MRNRFGRKPLRKAPRSSKFLSIVWRTPLIERSMSRTGMSITPCSHSTRYVGTPLAQAFAYSGYPKVYGPHIAALYARLSKLPNLTPLTHHFLSPSVDKISYKLMPGGPGYELAYSVTGVLEYLLSISPISGPTSSTSSNDPGSIYSDPETHSRLKVTFAAIARHEQTLVKRLLGHLTSEELVKRGVRVIGEETVSERRVPTISFVIVKGETGNAISGKDVAKVFDAKGNVSQSSVTPSNISRRSRSSAAGDPLRSLLCVHLGGHTQAQGNLDVDDGLVRISLVHYNVIEEVDRLIEVLDEALGLK